MNCQLHIEKGTVTAGQNTDRGVVSERQHSSMEGTLDWESMLLSCYVNQNTFITSPLSASISPPPLCLLGSFSVQGLTFTVFSYALYNRAVTVVGGLSVIQLACELFLIISSWISMAGGD